jgi:hypothetical protein
MREPPNLLRAAALTGVGFLAISLVWLRFSSIYDSAIVSGANALLPADLWLSRFGGTLTVRIVADTKEYGLAVDALMLHSGLIIVLALVAGTPRRSWTWRGGAAGIVVVLFYVLQVTGMAVYAVTLRSVLVGENLLGDVQIGFAIFWGLTPLVVGGLVTYRFWLPVFRRPGRPL